VSSYEWDESYCIFNIICIFFFLFQMKV
jgi:hypothetical protein